MHCSLVILVFLTSGVMWWFDVVHGLMCYSCDTTGGESPCNTPFNATGTGINIVTGFGGFPCKSCTKTYHIADDGSEKVTARGCSQGEETDGCEEHNGFSSCLCTADLCNSDDPDGDESTTVEPDNSGETVTALSHFKLTATSLLVYILLR